MNYFNAKLDEILEADNRRDFLKKTGVAALAASTGGLGKAASAVVSAAGSAAGSAAALPSALAKALETYKNSGLDDHVVRDMLFGLINGIKHSDPSIDLMRRSFLIKTNDSEYEINSLYKLLGHDIVLNSAEANIRLDGLIKSGKVDPYKEFNNLIAKGVIDLDKEVELLTGYLTQRIVDAVDAVEEDSSFEVINMLFSGDNPDRINLISPELAQWSIEAALDKYGIEDFKSCVSMVMNFADTDLSAWVPILKNSKALQNYFGLTPSKFVDMVKKGKYKELGRTGILDNNSVQNMIEYEPDGIDLEDEFIQNEREFKRKIKKQAESTSKHDKKFKPRSDEYKFSMHGPVDWDPDEPEHAWESVNKPHFTF